MRFRCLPLQLRRGPLLGQYAGQQPVPVCCDGMPCCSSFQCGVHASSGVLQMTGHCCPLLQGYNAICDMPSVPAGGLWWASLLWAWRPAL